MQIFGKMGRVVLGVMARTVRSRTVMAGTVAGIIAGAISVVVVDLLGPPSAWLQNTRTYNIIGKIIVESPEVYTRERLVNDRLRHAVWLERQMAATEKVLKEGKFRSLEGVWGQDAHTFVSMKMSGNNRTNKTSNVIASETVKTENDGTPNTTKVPGRDKLASHGSTVESTTELFRAMNEYREQVRTELMQTQLDDRHDIDGNTLYRMNFNTTIIHGQRSDALAIVRVILRHGTIYPNSNKLYRDYLMADYRDLLQDWSQELESQLNEAADNRMHLLTEGGARDRDSSEFYTWLRWKICKKLTGIAKTADYQHLIPSPDGAKGSSSRADPATIRAVSLFREGECGNRYYSGMGSNVNHVMDGDATGGALNWMIGDYVARFWVGKSGQDLIWNYADVRLELLEELRQWVKEDNGDWDRYLHKPLAVFRHLEEKWCRNQRNQRNTRSGGSAKLDDKGRSASNHSPGSNVMGARDSGLVVHQRISVESRRRREQALVRSRCLSVGRLLRSDALAMSALIDLYWHLEYLERLLNFGDGKKEVARIREMRDSSFNDKRNGEEGIAEIRIDEIGCRETALKRATGILGIEASNGPRGGDLEAEEEEIEDVLNREDGVVCNLQERPWIWRRNLAIEQQKDQFNREFVDAKSRYGAGTGILAGVLEVDVSGCEAGLCRISVNLAENGSEDTINEDGHSLGGNDAAVQCFLSKLDENYEAFSYGITPKNLRQRLAFGGSSTRHLAFALESPNANEGDLGGLVETVRREEDHLRSVVSQPIVIGFGRGKSAGPARSTIGGNEVNQMCNSSGKGRPNVGARGGEVESNGEEVKDNLSRGTEFGWIVAPEKRWGNGGGNWHPHRQYDLSAVVSIPSWWRQVMLEVRTCWRKTNDASEIGNGYMENCGRHLNEKELKSMRWSENRNYAIKLPGDTSEVSRKLRIEVRDVPYILRKMLGPDERYLFQVGQSADVVIEGGRLWRSTRVTLGTQSADSIVVLPHMKGIVATFECVERPPYWPEQLADNHQLFRSKIRVWTSEGVTNELPVRIVEGPMAEGFDCRREEKDGVGK